MGLSKYYFYEFSTSNYFQPKEDEEEISKRVSHYCGLKGIVKNCLKRAIIRLYYSPRINRKVKLPAIRCLDVDFQDFLPSLGLSKKVLIINCHMYYWLDKLGFFNQAEHTNAFFVLSLSDREELFENVYGFNLNKAREIFDLITTYNEIDANSLGLTVIPPIIRDYSSVITDINEIDRDNDVFFIGRDKGRSAIIYDIYEKCIRAGLRCLFLMVGHTMSPHHEGIKYVKEMEYSEILKIACKSKAILNIVQEHSSGITLRDIEAYSFGSFLITNNTCSVLNEFLDKSQIINIGESDWTSRLSSIKASNCRFPKKKNPYSVMNYYKFIAEKLEQLG